MEPWDLVDMSTHELEQRKAKLKPDETLVDRGIYAIINGILNKREEYKRALKRLLGVE